MDDILSKLESYRGQPGDPYARLAAHLGMTRDEALTATRRARAARARAGRGLMEPEAPRSLDGRRIMFGVVAAASMLVGASAAARSSASGTGKGWGWGLGGGGADVPVPDQGGDGDKPEQPEQPQPEQPEQPEPPSEDEGAKGTECEEWLDSVYAEVGSAIDWEKEFIATAIAANWSPKCLAWHQGNINAMEADLAVLEAAAGLTETDKCKVADGINSKFGPWNEPEGRWPGNIVPGSDECGVQQPGPNLPNPNPDQPDPDLPEGDDVPECINLGPVITQLEHESALSALAVFIKLGTPVPAMVDNGYPLGNDKRNYYRDAAVVMVAKSRNVNMKKQPYGNVPCVFNRQDVNALRAQATALYDSMQ